MRSRRGQAFETMMLVISVIVALAILAVLLQILGGFRFGVGDPKSAMSDQLRQIQGRGYGVLSAQEVTFEVGTVFMKEVIRDIPVLESDVCFICDNNLCGVSGKPLVPSTPTGVCKFDMPNDLALTVTKAGKIEVTSNVKAQIVGCGDSSVPKYCVAIARNAKSATGICTKACGLS